MKAKRNPSRFRFSVPESDLSVLDWCRLQDNLGFSLRLVIKDYIEANGLTDPTCLKVKDTNKIGRPKKAVNFEAVGKEEPKDELNEEKPIIKENAEKEDVAKTDDSDYDEGIDAINRLMNQG